MVSGTSMYGIQTLDIKVKVKINTIHFKQTIEIDYYVKLKIRNKATINLEGFCRLCNIISVHGLNTDLS